MEKKYQELILIIPNALQNIPSIRKIARLIRLQSPDKVMPEMQISFSLEQNSIVFLLGFNRNDYHPDNLKWLDFWIENLKIKMIDLELLDENKRKQLVGSFLANSGGQSLNNIEKVEEVMTGIEQKFINAEKKLTSYPSASRKSLSV